MGLRTTLKSLLGSDRRATRKAQERCHHDHCRQNAGLLELALKPGRMRSFTPDDLPAFYKAQEERAEMAEREEREKCERGRRAVEKRVLGSEGREEGKEKVQKVELGQERGDAVLIVPKRSGAISGDEMGTEKEERREAVVLPCD